MCRRGFLLWSGKCEYGKDLYMLRLYSSEAGDFSMNLKHLPRDRGQNRLPQIDRAEDGLE